MGRKCLVASEVSLRGHRCCRAVEHPQDVVERITLRWSLSGGSYQVEDLVETQALSSVGSCLVIDLLAHDRAFEVVHAERQRCLREERRDHDPVRLDVVEVVEKESPDGEIAQIVKTCGGRSFSSELFAELVVIGMIGQRDVSEESVGLVLEITQHRQMLDTIFNRLHMAVEHGAVGSNPQAVSDAVYFDPILS